MKYFGLSKKELKQIIDNIHPEGWIESRSADSKKASCEPSTDQLEAVRVHLETIYKLDKRKEYLQQLIDRLRPEVEGKTTGSQRRA